MTTTAQAASFVDVDALRVGMFVHLDLGWMSHPFPLSSFRIGSQKQIDTIRGLGLKRVRWCPERSETEEPTAAPPPAAPALPPEDTLARAAAAAKKTAAAQERAALRQCEKQFAEAAAAMRTITNTLATDPRRAGADAVALAGTIVAKMLDARELNIRVLSESTGDRASTHGINVAIIALLMGRSFGLGRDEMVELGVGAMLHDIGKLELPGQLRNREPGFTAAETERWRSHVALGVGSGKKMGLSPGALQIIAQHHEQADGRGFPAALHVGSMTAAARIVALVDRFDNLCNPVTPTTAMTPHEALSLMFAQSQQQFDSTMLSAFIRMIGVYPPGSAVQLTDDRYARVTAINSTRPLKPRVQLLDTANEDDMEILDLEAAPGLGIRRSLTPAQLPPAVRRRFGTIARVLYGFEPTTTEDSAKHPEAA